MDEEVKECLDSLRPMLTDDSNYFGIYEEARRDLVRAMGWRMEEGDGEIYVENLSHPIMVFDAKGREIDKKIVMFDENTGRVEFILEDDEGNPVVRDGMILHDVEFHPAPLTWRKKDG